MLIVNCSLLSWSPNQQACRSHNYFVPLWKQALFQWQTLNVPSCCEVTGTLANVVANFLFVLFVFCLFAHVLLSCNMLSSQGHCRIVLHVTRTLCSNFTDVFCHSADFCFPEDTLGEGFISFTMNWENTQWYNGMCCLQTVLLGTANCFYISLQL